MKFLDDLKERHRANALAALMPSSYKIPDPYEQSLRIEKMKKELMKEFEFFKPEHCDHRGVSFISYGKASQDFKTRIDLISLEQANALIRERSQVVYGGKFCLDGEWTFVSHNHSPHNTHQALLIGVREIEKEDTAESLLREMLNSYQGFKLSFDWDVRARKLLEREGK